MARLTSYRRIFIFVLLLPALLSSPSLNNLDTVHAASDNCNLVKNTAFEQGSSSSFTNWGLGVFSGAATLTEAKHPIAQGVPGVYNSVQSGSRAPKIQVTQAGTIYLTTLPESSGAIPVTGNTSYKYSLRVFASTGAKARLEVLQWNSSGADMGIRLNLPHTNGTGDWVTLETTFTTHSNSRFVSLRLMLDNGTGTYYVDDALLSTNSSSQCVDVRHYIMQSTPGFAMCRSFGSTTECTDSYKESTNEFVVTINQNAQTHTTDYWANTGTSSSSVGIHKNHGPIGYTDPTIVPRCFTNPGSNCGSSNANYPAQTMDLMRRLPVLQSSSIPNNARTSGAYMVHNWQSFQVQTYNPTTGAQGSVWGVTKHREFAFIAAQVNFGGTLGVQNNVLVYESEFGDNSLNMVNGGQFFERYYYVRGYGRVRMSFGIDSNCTLATPSGCDGAYTSVSGSGAINDANWNIKLQNADWFGIPTSPNLSTANWWW